MTTERFANRYLTLRIATGALLLVIGMIALRKVILASGAELNPYAFMLPLLVCGFGMGTAIMSLFQVTMSSVEMEDAGAGSGTTHAFQQIGTALGIAIAGTIFFGRLEEGGTAPEGDVARHFVDATATSTFHSIAVFGLLTVLVGVSAWKPRKDTA